VSKFCDGYMVFRASLGEPCDPCAVWPAVNDDWGSGTRKFTVRKGATGFSYELPAGAVATFVLR
jgi:hypothetical protein